MAPFFRPYTTLYWSAIVSIAVFLPFSSYIYIFIRYLSLNNIVTLKYGLKVTQGHLKWYHSKAWVRFPICIL